MKQLADYGLQSRFNSGGRKFLRKMARHSCAKQSPSLPAQGASDQRKLLTSTDTYGGLFIVYYSKSLSGEHSIPNWTPSLQHDSPRFHSARKMRFLESY